MLELTEFNYITATVVVLLSTVLVIALLGARSNRARVRPTRDLAILITGCDGGFGELLTKALAALGFMVFAACLTPAGVQRWSASEGVVAFECNVTDTAAVDAAAERIQSWLKHGYAAAAKPNGGRRRSLSRGSITPSAPSGQRRLHAVVNNAGVGSGGYVDWVPVAEYQRVMDVNFMGTVRVTKAMLPLMAPTAGSVDASSTVPSRRIVNVSSVAGLVAPGGMSAYCASKFAVEAFSDSLRRELAVWGTEAVQGQSRASVGSGYAVDVSIVEPGWTATPMLAMEVVKARALVQGLPQAVRARWPTELVECYPGTVADIVAGALPPHPVVEAMVHAVTSPRPAIRYQPGSFPKTLGLVALLPAAVVDWITARR